MRYATQLSVISLVLLALIFFWRILTPVTADQASFRQGDFSGQFVAFGAYQYARMSQGEIPLWNPYNNGGFPFVADTQAAVFYPPRLLTIALSTLHGSWTYAALQLEAVLHVLLYSLFMFAFVHRLTNRNNFAAWVAAVSAAYGGFISGYPPLQLALLEAVIWLPLVLLGILRSTEPSTIHWRWLAFAGWALGLSWLAGHPQSSWFLTYLAVAYLIFRSIQQRYQPMRVLVAIVILGLITVGVTAVTLLPGMEYLLLTTRSSFGFDAKGNGFPMQDILQFVLPGSVSIFSPLYIGILPLIALMSAWRSQHPQRYFWFGAALFALLLSFGANSVVYHTLYYLIPGLQFFRGQERAAFIVVSSLSILAGIGISDWLRTARENQPNTSLGFAWLLILLLGLGTLAFVTGWLGGLNELYPHLSALMLSLVSAVGVLLLLRSGLAAQHYSLWILLLGFVLVFDLFSTNMDSRATYDPIPATEQLSIQPPELVQAVLDRQNSPLARVDGFRGLEANYGSLYGLADMRGISPLFLDSAAQIIYSHYTDNPLAWELFAVRYVFSGSDQLSVASTVIATGQDRTGPVWLHELRDPRPFAQLMYAADIVDSDEFARSLLNDPRFDPRQNIILHQEPTLSLPDNPPAAQPVTVTTFAPEFVEIRLETDSNAILSLSQVDYPGWSATVNDAPAKIIRAYGGLIAVELEPGSHIIQLSYEPIIYRIGLILSLVTWGLLTILFMVTLIQAFTQHDRTQEQP